MARKAHLLIVDDETNVLLTLQLVFHDAGYSVATASGETQALQLLRKRKFDALLTDMSMDHDQSGLAIVEAASKLRPRPVIVLFTGFGTLENVRATLGTAVDHFALKPLDLNQFKYELARLLALRSDGAVAAS
jgi:DNA-binding NtrC family response regulator